MKAPFPWFGGKSRVAPEVWAALGDVDNYIEPFAGSLAVLLARSPHHKGTTETVNDKDLFLANFWRALIADPDGVAHHANWPVNEADLFARHMWLVQIGQTQMEEALLTDPDYFDSKIAGWWVWGVASWIGSGRCSGTGPWSVDGRRVTKGARGQGVNRQLPHLGDAGKGVNRQLPHLGDAGHGVNRQHESSLQSYLVSLSERLERVRVCTGDWGRVVTTGAMSYGSSVGIFLDPPYSGEVRTKDIYSEDDHEISHAVRQWALDNGDNPRLRIVLAGYGPEHDHLMPQTWRRHWWSASAAYSTNDAALRGDGNHLNRLTECLWMSPHCIQSPDMTLFDK